MAEKAESNTVKEEVMDLISLIEKEIDNLPDDNPSKAEGKIRKIDDMIKRIPDDKKAKTALESSLKEKALLGLSKDLQALMSLNGLELEGLPLVREYLTTKPDLASFFLKNPDDKVQSALKMIKRKLYPKLEVLGELVENGFDSTNERVQKLIEAAPSLQELKNVLTCTDKLRELRFHVKERKIISNLGKVDSVDGIHFANKKQKEERQKSQKAKKLMNEAKELVGEDFDKNKKQVKAKIEQIKHLVDLPSDWNNNDKEDPNELLEILNKKIAEIPVFEESTSNFESMEEIVSNASGGLALKAIYYSKWAKPQTSDVPILKSPQSVDSFSSKSPYETGFCEFSEGDSAVMFSKEVEDSGLTHAVHVCGLYATAAADLNISYGSQKRDETQTLKKTTTTKVSATKFCRSAMKCFSVPRTEMYLTDHARQMVLKIKQEKPARMKEEIRKFFKIYGSHVPIGCHQLGGLFFAISTAKSTNEMEASTLMNLNANQLNAQVSSGFFGGLWGIGVSDKHEQSSAKASRKGLETESKSVNYTFNVKSIGPQADNLDTFKRLLCNNSTWAILDRGDMKVSVPVWDLLLDKEPECQSIAKQMEEVWEEDEKEKRARSEERQILNTLLLKVLSSCNNRHENFPMPGKVSGGGVLKLFNKAKKREDAFTLACDFICQDAQKNVCVIFEDSGANNITVSGWTAEEGLRFKNTNDGHLLIYHTFLLRHPLTPRRYGSMRHV